MEKVFKIGSSRKYSEGYTMPKNTTATIKAKVITVNGIEFYAGAAFTNGKSLAGSMCYPADSFNDFCQALLRKAYGAPKPRPKRNRFNEGINICGRKFRKCTNPSWWRLEIVEAANEPLYEWVCEPNRSAMYSNSRR